MDSIRTFDVDTQRSVENLSEVFLYPASEFPTEEDQRVSFYSILIRKTHFCILMNQFEFWKREKESRRNL